MTRSTIRAAIRGGGGLAVLAIVFLALAPAPAAAEIEREDLIKEADFLTKLVLERIRLQCFVRRSEPNKSVSCPRDTWATGGGIEIVPTQADGTPVPTAQPAPQPGAPPAPRPAAAPPPATRQPAPHPAKKLPPAVASRPDVEGGATAKTGWTCENQDGRPPPPFVPATSAESVAAGKVPPPPPATMCYVICCEIVDAKKAQPRSRRKMR